MDVVLELVGGLCNSRCVWCFNQYKVAEKIKKGMMSLEKSKIFADLNTHSNISVIPYGHGEALINPDFVEIIKYNIGVGILPKSMHTNLAMNLTPSHFETLCKFKRIVVNVGGGTAKTHYENMKTNMTNVLSNLQEFVRIKQQTQSGIKIEVKMLLNKRNISEVSLLKKEISNIDSRIRVSTYPLYFAASDGDNNDKLKFIEENLTSGVSCRDAWGIQNGLVTVKTKLRRCYGLIPTVRWDGAVNVCCRERYHNGIVGDAFKTPMREIVRSSEYKRAERLGRRRKYVEYCKYCS